MKSVIETLGGIGCVVLAVVVAVVLLGGGYIIYLNTFGVATQNAERNVQQQSLPYIQAHQEQLESYYHDYQTGDAAQQAASKTLICQQAPLLIRSQWPPQIETFFDQNC